jgi:hypothetical protein
VKASFGWLHHASVRWLAGGFGRWLFQSASHRSWRKRGSQRNVSGVMTLAMALPARLAAGVTERK